MIGDVWRAVNGFAVANGSSLLFVAKNISKLFVRFRPGFLID